MIRFWGKNIVQKKIWPEKPCPKCGEVKSASEFHRCAARSDGLSWECKACSFEYNHDRCPACGGVKLKKSNVCGACHKRVTDLTKFHFFAWKLYKQRRCQKCGRLLSGRRGLCHKCSPGRSCKINYCTVCGKVVRSPKRRCGECEGIGGSVQLRKYRVSEYKAALRSGGCVVCGYDRCLESLEFHHIGRQKDIAISRASTVGRIREEIQNNPVVVLCANCHRELHSGLMDETRLHQKRLREPLDKRVAA